MVRREKPKKTVYTRAIPYTTVFPTEFQRRARQEFSELAKLARDKEGLSPEGIPWSAYFVKEGMKGKRFGRTEKKTVYEERVERVLGVKEAVRRRVEAFKELSKLIRKLEEIYVRYT